jgi:CubicO group peptidase (beta-lactamase class C family)
MKKSTAVAAGIVFVSVFLSSARIRSVFDGIGAVQVARALQNPSSKGASVEARIAGVENGLLPPVLIKGRPVPVMKLANRMAFFKVPGVSIAVMSQGHIDWARGYGLADVASKRPVTPETRFQAASISKSVAASAVLHFVEDGRISLDRNVNDYLKSWKVPDNQFTKVQKVTLRRILSHSAGLTVHGFPGYVPGTPLPTLVQILNGSKPANTRAIRVDLVPGTKWRYSGGGYTVMQQMLIDVLGKPFAAIMQRTVLQVFGMKESAYSQPLRPDWRGYAATGYRPDGNPVRGKYHTYPELAAAGLWTTPSDLDRFAIGLQQALAGQSNPVISENMAKQMLTRQIDDDGLGVFLDGSGHDLRFSHGGANEGFQCMLMAYARAGQGAAVMTNSDTGGALIQEIMFAIAREYGWPGYGPKVRTAVKIDPGIFKQYVGRYQLQAGFIITISARRGHLFAQATNQPELELFPESVTTYFATDANIEAVFEHSAAGRITALEIHQGGQSFTAKRIQSVRKAVPRHEEH